MYLSAWDRQKFDEANMKLTPCCLFSCSNFSNSPPNSRTIWRSYNQFVERQLRNYSVYIDYANVSHNPDKCMSVINIIVYTNPKWIYKVYNKIIYQNVKVSNSYFSKSFTFDMWRMNMEHWTGWCRRRTSILKNKMIISNFWFLKIEQKHHLGSYLLLLSYFLEIRTVTYTLWNYTLVILLCFELKRLVLNFPIFKSQKTKILKYSCHLLFFDQKKEIYIYFFPDHPGWSSRRGI